MVGVRPHVTCAACGRIHVLERTFSQATAFPMLCHDCEAPLTVVVPRQELHHTVAAVQGVPVVR